MEGIRIQESISYQEYDSPISKVSSIITLGIVVFKPNSSMRVFSYFLIIIIIIMFFRDITLAFPSFVVSSEVEDSEI